MKSQPTRRAGRALWLLFVLAWAPRAYAAGEAPWSVFSYGGRWSANRIAQIVRFHTKFEESYVWAVGGSRALFGVPGLLTSEVEAVLAGHSGLQEHLELSGALCLRWRAFPWSDYLATSLAYGLGPSLAFRPPPIERAPDHQPTRVLVSMPVEATFGPPARSGSSWEFLVRVHHRSGAFGHVNRAKGSNFISFGVRYRF